MDNNFLSVYIYSLSLMVMPKFRTSQVVLRKTLWHTKRNQNRKISEIIFLVRRGTIEEKMEMEEVGCLKNIMYNCIRIKFIIK